MKKLFLLLLLFLTISIYSQNNKLGYPVTLIAEGNQNNAAFMVYSPPLKIKALYTDSLQAKNQLPEELIMSVLSANSQEWINYNYLGL